MPKPNNLKKGVKFSSDNQPDPEAKSKGRIKKYLLKDIAKQLVNGKSKIALKELADYLDVNVDQIDIETAMHLKQMELALKNGDTKAYNAVMDRLNGKPIQAITMEEINIRTSKYINATGHD